MSWTLVHPITENSPLFGFSKDDFKNTDGELLVFVTTFDDMFSATVSAKTSYIFDEIKYGEKFGSMYSVNEDKSKTVLHLDKLNDTYKVDLE